MRKIPTLFVRDWDHDPSRVTRDVTPGCEWVLAGEGVATQKLDGQAALIRSGTLYRRHAVREGKQVPDRFEEIERDEETGKIVGWVPVGNEPEDRYFNEAYSPAVLRGGLPDGTYELLGPKVQGNAEGRPNHVLVAHADAKRFPEAPRDYDGLEQFLHANPIEGLVWHHPLGFMAKIKARDFGIHR